MNAKTEKKYWDNIYSNNKSDKNNLITSDGILKKLIYYYKKLLDNQNNYAKFVFFKICKKYLKNNHNKKIVEIGSAPGDRLIFFNRHFGYNSYGVEYSEAGVLLNIKNFENNNLNSKNVINSDFFSSDFQLKYNEHFDIVTSFGFIEHFNNVEEVIQKHLDILKKGGIIMVVIPNLNGINHIIQKFADEKVLGLHNLDIMNLNNFKKLFNGSEELYCDYYGLFNASLFVTKNKYKKIVLKTMRVIQLFFDPFWRLIFNGNRIIENKSTSPYLIYVGIKK